MRLKCAGLVLVCCWLSVAAPPTPESHFGHKMGAARRVLDWDRVVSYFRALEKSSSRIRVEEYGRSAGGRPLVVALLSAPETLRALPRYIDIQRRLADPRITSPAQAGSLIRRGKTVVLITCSIHSTEIGATQAAVELAYRMLTGDRPRFRAILENTIVLLVPSLNPDGLDLVSRWYRKTLGTPFEGTSPPELYQKYVGHDNNRDWYIFSQPETRATVARLHNVWHPHIVYDLHQQGAYGSRMFVPPWMDPIEPNIDPILVQEGNLIGMGMAMDLTAAGKTGVVVNALYDCWTPARHYQAYHAGMRILSEAASARIASPLTVKPGEIEDRAPGYNPRERSWNYLEPWLGGEWGLGDIIDYELIAMESCLYQAATRREDLLRNFYRIGKRAVERKTPFAFWIPPGQRDPGATRKLVETLEFGMVEVDRRKDGGYLIRMRQPYSGFAKTLLERQHYPDLRLYPGGPPRRPYDVTAHTLPLLMGVRVETVDAEPPPGAPPRPDGALLSGADTASWFAVNQKWKAGSAVWRDPASGDFSFDPRPGWKRLEPPRIGLYKSFVPNIDEGWTRWVLEQFGFEYASVGNHEIRAGGLKPKYGVLLFADQSPAVIENGYRPGAMPDEFTGGLGNEGAAALREFAAMGGTLIFLNRAAAWGIDRLGLPVKNVLSGVSSRDFFCPGSLLNASLTSGHPLTLGLPAEITLWNEHSPAWEAAGGSVARYVSSNVLASGWLLGEKHIAGKSALVDARLGRGHVLLFGMRPQYRAQSYLTFKLLFNALVAW